MAIYEITKDQIRTVSETSFGKAGVRERGDLQRLLRDQIHIVSPDTLVVSEEFGDWEDSRRRIDLLGLDKQANLVVIELKRTDDGGHSELQSLRYAAMVSTLKFDQCVAAHEAYLEANGIEEDAAERILNFLGWDEANEDDFAQEVRIVLVSAEFSKEITTAVMWLNEQGLDIRCVRLKPYSLENKVLVDVQQVIPLPEAAQYQVQIREKKQQEKTARAQKWDEPSFMHAVTSTTGAEAARLANDIYTWVSPLVDEVTWGERVLGRMTPTLRKDGTRYQLFVVRTTGTVRVHFLTLHSKKPFDNRQELEQLLAKFNGISGVNFPPTVLDGKPSFRIELLSDPVAMDKFKSAILWMIDKIRLSYA